MSSFLGIADAWDNLIRVESVQAAAELMEMSEISGRLEITDISGGGHVENV